MAFITIAANDARHRAMEGQAMKIATMAVVCVAATFNAGAHAVALDDTRTVKVGYEDLNLTTRQGKQALIRRIQRAADLVCGAPDTRDLMREASYRNCVTNATNGALSHVKWPQS
jgi:UrcA family protein